MDPGGGGFCVFKFLSSLFIYFSTISYFIIPIETSLQEAQLTDKLVGGI